MTFSAMTSFRPSLHGFRFPNQFKNHFGPVQTYGRCNGMSWVALDYFHAGRAAPAITDVDFERRIVSPLSAAITPAGVVQLFALREGDGGTDIVGKTLRGSRISPWGRCAVGSGPVVPAACCWGPNRTDLVVAGYDRNVYNLWRDGTELADVRATCGSELPGFELLGGVSDLPLAMASPGPMQLEVYRVGAPDRKVHVRRFDGQWHDWESLGAPLDRPVTSGVAAASAPGFRSVLVRGADNALWERSWAGGQWSGWQSVQGVLTSGAAATASSPTQLQVYARGHDGNIWGRWRDSGTWSGWFPLGTPPGGTPEEAPAAVVGPGGHEVFARDNHGDAWRRCHVAGAWHGWQPVEVQPSTDAKRLASAIFDRNMSSTVAPLIAATAALGAGLLFLGPARNYVTWRSPSTEQTFRWTATDELRKLSRLLSAGRPVPLGLIGFHGWGHEVVAYGIDSDADIAPHLGELPGSASHRIHVYDPNHPGCDSVTIAFSGRDATRPIDEAHPAIRSSTGEIWRGCFVRDDYLPAAPPL